LCYYTTAKLAIHLQQCTLFQGVHRLVSGYPGTVVSFIGQMPFLLTNQQCHSTWRHTTIVYTPTAKNTVLSCQKAAMQTGMPSSLPPKSCHTNNDTAHSINYVAVHSDST